MRSTDGREFSSLGVIEFGFSSFAMICQILFPKHDRFFRSTQNLLGLRLPSLKCMKVHLRGSALLERQQLRPRERLGCARQD
jgi:hypothetical protein